MIRKNHSLKDISESIDRYSKENAKIFKEHNDSLVELTKHTLKLAITSNRIAFVGAVLAIITTAVALASVIEMRKAYSLSQDVIALSEKSFSYFKKNSKETAETADKAINLSENALTFTKESFAELSRRSELANELAAEANEIIASQPRNEEIRKLVFKVYSSLSVSERGIVQFAGALCVSPNKQPKINISTLEELYKGYEALYEINKKLYFLLATEKIKLNSNDVLASMVNMVAKVKSKKESFSYEEATIAVFSTLIQTRFLRRELDQLNRKGLKYYIKPELQSAQIDVNNWIKVCEPYINAANADFESSKAQFSGIIYKPSKELSKIVFGLPMN
jgi:hypothetical protein